jgi:hypothetical protein
MIQAPNYHLKGVIIAKYGTLSNAAREFKEGGLLNMDHFRLSRIIHGRCIAKQEEMRIISWKLQMPIRELFRGNGQ